MTLLRFGLGLALAALLAGRLGAQADSLARRPFSFAVLGHIRGDADGKLNPKLGELLDRVRPLRPDFVVLTGDVIYGDLHAQPPDTAEVRREWDQVDSALATLRVPVYRVPGNHDISDLGSKRVWWQRYGPLPGALERHRSRFLLVGSAWIPADGDTVRQLISRPAALDSATTAWLKAQLARSEWDHTFLLMHHMLWWDPNARWWKEIHPLLRPAGVRIVFGGDYGPLKFSQQTRDSVLYVQSSMEGFTSLRILQDIETSRILSAQFDNFLLVHVDGPAVAVEVKTLGEFSSPQYQPAFYEAMMHPPGRPLRQRAGDLFNRLLLLGKPGKLALLAALGLATFLAGIMLGRRFGKRRR